MEEFTVVEQMTEVIKNLMCSDSEVIRKATADLKEACKSPGAVQALCRILETAPEEHVRLYSAVLLKKIFSKIRRWNKVPLEQQDRIKKGLVQTFMQEEQVTVRKAIAHVVGILVEHVCRTSEAHMNDMWQIIHTFCSSDDPKQSELGSRVFAILAESVPDHFLPYMDLVSEMLHAALLAHEAAGNMATQIMCDILSGMSSLVPLTLNHINTKQTLQNDFTRILKTLYEFACQHEVDMFLRAFDLLESMVENYPTFPTNDLKMLIEFCIEVSTNRQFDDAVGVKVLDHIGWLVELKNKRLVQLGMIDGIIRAVFNFMVTEGDDYVADDEHANPMTSATHTMDVLAFNIPSEELIPPVLRLVGPALQNQDPLPRRAAYMSMAAIAEGCSEAICFQYLHSFMNVITEGLTDATPSVRNAACFALSQFSEHLQPDIAKFASQIMPICFQYVQQFCAELRTGTTDETRNIELIFSVLESLCGNMDDELMAYLQNLMEILLEGLRQGISVRVRKLALSVVCAAANAIEEKMMPYLPRLILILQSFLEDTDDVDIKTLLPQSIDTLATLARAVGSDNFTQFAAEFMNFALNLITTADDTDVRRALYNLMGALAPVLKEQMACRYPEIIQRMFNSLLSIEEVESNIIENDINLNFNMEQSDDEEEGDDIEDIANDCVENLNLQEKEGAILALKVFAEETGATFMTYLKPSYDMVCPMINHSEEDIRKASVAALCAFVIALFKQKDIIGVTNATITLLPKLCEIVKNDEEIKVVVAALEGINEILVELKKDALSSEDLCNSVFACIEHVIGSETTFQGTEFEEDEDETDEESEEEAIFQAAANLLPIFGLAMTPGEFAPYFRRSFPNLLQKLQNSIRLNSFATVRTSAYDSLAHCCEALQDQCGAFFGTLCPVMIGGLTDDCDNARYYAAYGLGELVLHSGQSSYHAYQQILNALYVAITNETEPIVLDNICGAISRVITTNCELVPLAEVVPVYMQYLPLREDFSEHFHILKCFSTLYEKYPTAIIGNLKRVTDTITQVLSNNRSENAVSDLAMQLLHCIYMNHPELVAAEAGSNEDLARILRSM